MMSETTEITNTLCTHFVFTCIIYSTIKCSVLKFLTLSWTFLDFIGQNHAERYLPPCQVSIQVYEAFCHFCKTTTIELVFKGSA